ncbi:uncharacterized protein [Palaemon carinicauda]|uniref:uncharacterized protein n=1 Tax=Palaemon carinicauda TaxID=392227 RepID=UPI0035B616E0
MEKWKSALLMMVAGIAPVTITIVVLTQFKIIDLATGLLLAFIYLLFISSHVWCRIFTTISPSSSEEEVDALPCYEDITKSDPPSYYTLYPDVKTSGDTNTSLASKAAAGSCSVDIPFSSELEKNPHILPVFTISNEDHRGMQRASLVSELEPCSPSSGSSTVYPAAACGSSEPRPSLEDKKRRMKKENLYSKILENVVNPVDL